MGFGAFVDTEICLCEAARKILHGLRLRVSIFSHVVCPPQSLPRYAVAKVRIFQGFRVFVYNCVGALTGVHLFDSVWVGAWVGGDTEGGAWMSEVVLILDGWCCMWGWCGMSHCCG